MIELLIAAAGIALSIIIKPQTDTHYTVIGDSYDNSGILD